MLWVCCRFPVTSSSKPKSLHSLSDREPETGNWQLYDIFLHPLRDENHFNSSTTTLTGGNFTVNLFPFNLAPSYATGTMTLGFSKLL